MKNKVTVFLLFICFIGIIQINALADSNDDLSLVSPRPNEVVSGTVNVSWYAFDDENTNVPYQIALRDSATCSDTYGVISEGSTLSSTSELRTVSFNTKSSIQGLATIEDKDYCLQICNSFLNNSSDYSACIARKIIVRNNNTNPNISNLPKSLSLKVNQQYSLKLNYTDKESDKAIFQVLESVTGASLSSSGSLSIRIAKPGNYILKMGLQDEFGGLSIYNLPISVVSASTPTKPEESNNTNNETEFTLTRLEKTNSTSGSSVTIEWQAEKSTTSNYILRYAYYGDGTQELNRVGIASVNKDTDSYTVDTSDYSSGNYKFILVRIGNDGEESEIVSDFIEINKNVVVEDGYKEKPLIIDIVPGPATTIIDMQPAISGKFSPPANKNIDISTFEFSFNGEDKTSWCKNINESSFECYPDESIGLGIHKVNVRIADSIGVFGEREWTFTIQNESGDIAEGIFIFGRIIPYTTLLLSAFVFVLALAILVIPWFIYNNLRNRETNTDYYNENSYSYRDDNTEIEVNYVPVETAKTPFISNSSEETKEKNVVSYANKTDEEYIDPTNYNTYEDYLEAVDNSEEDDDLDIMTPNYIKEAGLDKLEEKEEKSDEDNSTKKGWLDD